MKNNHGKAIKRIIMVALLAALKKAEMITAGIVPMPRKTIRCKTCYLNERCTDEPKKLSDIIG